jgi:site-specific recombinase XerC
MMPDSSRVILDAISVRQDGRAASAANIARKRSVFTKVLRYAVEPGYLAANPLDRLSCSRPPRQASPRRD